MLIPLIAVMIIGNLEQLGFMRKELVTSWVWTRDPTRPRTIRANLNNITQY